MGAKSRSLSTHGDLGTAGTSHLISLYHFSDSDN
jgi:hypothetical protein